MTTPSTLQRDQAALATVPTAATRFLRTFVPWQALRFLIINLKMLLLIRRSHRGR